MDAKAILKWKVAKVFDGVRQTPVFVSRVRQARSRLVFVVSVRSQCFRMTSAAVSPLPWREWRRQILTFSPEISLMDIHDRSLPWETMLRASGRMSGS